MSIPPHADTDSKEGKVPEKARAAVLVESVPLPEGTPTVKGSKPLIHTCRVWYRAKSGNLDYHTLTRFYCAFPRGELSYLVPLGSENISAPYFKQCFFWGGVLPPRLSQTPRLPVPRQK